MWEKVKIQTFIGGFLVLFTLNQLALSEISAAYKPEASLSENSGETKVLTQVITNINDEGNGLIENNPSQQGSNINGDTNISLDEDKEKKPFSGHRIVHLDLKGAPPKVSYLAEFFPLIKMLGATGVIIEYEDMFPYSGIEVSAKNAYTKVNIETILKLCKDNDLEVIPLIQTFGHLEFVLKLKQYTDIREIGKYPQVVCPTKNETMLLLKIMIDEMLSMHPETKYIHIGCDEVYHLGKCNSCMQTMMRSKWSKRQLFLHHVTTVATYIREKYPSVTPLMWDDEFRKIPLQELTNSDIGSLVEPVVWKYTPNIETYLPDKMWDKYATVFKNIWVASAFKGATGPNKYVTDINYHLANHKAWMKLLAKYSEKVNFQGIILTGWQRYDHFSVLCELLPAGIPSLATNLIYVSTDIVEMKEILNTVGSKLECGPGFLTNNIGSRCGFPGAGIYEAAVRLLSLSEQIKHIAETNVAKGWFTSYNIEIGMSNPSHVEEATFELERAQFELATLQQDVVQTLNELYNPDTVDEWLDTNIKPLMKLLETHIEGRKILLGKREWPKRPFSTGEL